MVKHRHVFCDLAKTEACRSLWKAVLSLALKDALGNNDESSRAYHWIMNNREDFKTVCEFAGWNPDSFRKKFKEITNKKVSLMRRY